MVSRPAAPGYPQDIFSATFCSRGKPRISFQALARPCPLWAMDAPANRPALAPAAPGALSLHVLGLGGPKSARCALSAATPPRARAMLAPVSGKRLGQNAPFHARLRPLGIPFRCQKHCAERADLAIPRSRGDARKIRAPPPCERAMRATWVGAKGGFLNPRDLDPKPFVLDSSRRMSRAPEICLLRPKCGQSTTRESGARKYVTNRCGENFAPSVWEPLGAGALSWPHAPRSRTLV